MSATWRSFLRDERGFVITAELVLISTVLVLGLVAALSAVKTAIAGELGDVAGAIGSLNQSYYTHGFKGRSANGHVKARTYGSAFLDREDSSDEQEADFATAFNTACVAPAVVVPTNPCVTPGCAIPAPGCCASQVLPAPCGVAPCESAPCGAVPYGAAPCATSPCGTAPCATAVPLNVCPPGPAPYLGTDPFAPGAVSQQNMVLQGISYGGRCAPPLPEISPPQAPGCCESTTIPVLPAPVQ
jgi:Flp pilus assembly pilin Flp